MEEKQPPSQDISNHVLKVHNVINHGIKLSYPTDVRPTTLATNSIYLINKNNGRCK